MSEVTEVNRQKNLTYNKDIPDRIMYNNREVEFVCIGDELSPKYVEQCKYRWQKSFEKLLPSQIYGNWFNYIEADTDSYSTTDLKSIKRWQTQYRQRRVICDDTPNTTVDLINYYTVHTSNTDDAKNLSITPPITTINIGHLNMNRINIQVCPREEIHQQP